MRGVHATHRLDLHRPPRAGDRLSTTATVVALEPRAPGAYMVLRLETVDAAGRPVSTTDTAPSTSGGVRAALLPRAPPLSGPRGEVGT